MRLQQATIADYKSVLSFYDDVIARTQDIKRFARWQKGKHPTPEGLRAYIQEGSLYLYKEQDAIIGAVAITMYQGEDYHAIDWSRIVEDDEVAVIHRTRLLTRSTSVWDLRIAANSGSMPRTPVGKNSISLSIKIPNDYYDGMPTIVSSVLCFWI